MGRYNRTLMDYTEKTTTIGVWVADLNAGNIAAQLTLQANFGAAINDMCTGSLQQISYGNIVEGLQPAPSDQTSQRKLRWEVHYRDTVTNDRYHFTMGTADLTNLDPNKKGFAQIGDGDVVDAFVAAAEAYVVSPDGNAIEILDIEMKGANV